MDYAAWGGLVIALLALATVPARAAGPGAPTYLRCEHLTDPLGVDAERPRLSWEIQDSRRGARQTAYQVVVATSRAGLAGGKADVLDTGRVQSSATHDVEVGTPLHDRTLYWWRVRTWDQNQKASPWSRPAPWMMGIRDPAGWKAKWIGDPSPAPERRSAHNGYHSAFGASADEAKRVRIDLGARKLVDGVVLWPARPYDWQPDTPGFLFPRRFRLLAGDTPDLQQARVIADRTTSDVANPGQEALRLACTPTEARYVTLEVTRQADRDTGHYAFALAEMQVLSGGAVVSQGARVDSLDGIEQGGWSARNLTDGDLTSHPASGAGPMPPPRLRHEFEVAGGAKRATLFITALGLYEARINGSRVGDHVLAPEWTDYHKRVQYQAYDVTGFVRRGANALAVQLGDGWYAGRIGLAGMVPGGPMRGIYGPRPLLLAQLEIVYPDGKTLTVATDPSWRSSTEGPIRSSDILDGEVYDARREQDGWDRPGFDDAAWKPATVADAPAGRLVAQPNEPIRVCARLPAVSVAEPKPGVYVFDMGQNMVGWCRSRLAGKAGAVLTLRYAEALNPDGTVYTANLRGAPQTDWYTAAGSTPRTWQPSFTYHGFRYVEVSGLAARPAPTDLTGCVVHSSSPEVGRFECSDGSLNRLWQNVRWTQRANLMSVPTDCPQRDERLGWMGDIQAFAQTAIFNMDMAAFFTKWLHDVSDDQARDGRFPDFAPHPFDPDARSSGAPAWGDAGVIVPWRAYVNYGDRRLLAQCYEPARRWVEYIHGLNADLLWRNGRNADYNDWLNADTLVLPDWPKSGGAVPNEVLATAFFAYSTRLVARMAEALGRGDNAMRYGRLADSIRQAFCSAYVGADGRIEGDTQAGYALALSFDLLPAEVRPLAVRHMIEAFGRYRGHLSTGIQTTHRLMLELTRAGRTDEAYRLLKMRTIPSWLYAVDHGATTIWERWDGYVEGRGFQDPGMNSFNHWALGAVGEWIYRVMLGLSPDESAPGWQRFAVRPEPGGDVTWACGSYRSIAGPIEVSWRVEGSAFNLDLVVPANTTATVYLPVRDAGSVREGGHPAAEAPGVRPVQTSADTVVYQVSAGTYHFEAAR